MDKRLAIFVLLLSLWFPALALAAPGEASLPEIAEEGLGPIEVLDQQFYVAVNKALKGNSFKADREFAVLRNLATEYGFSNLLSYSLKLLESASTVSREERQRRAYLVHTAVMLSPDDARVLVKAAAQHSAIGFGPALKYLFAALLALPSQPMVLSIVLTNLLFFSLVALTLSMLLVLVVQFSVRSQAVYAAATSWIPKSLRGIFGPFFYLGVLTLPLLGGVLAVLAVWSFILSTAHRSCRWFACSGGVVIASWVFALPMIDSFSGHLGTAYSPALDAAVSGTLEPSWALVEENYPRSHVGHPLLSFGRARYWFSQRELDNSEQVFQTLVERYGDSSPMGRASLMNLGATHFAKRDYQRALEVFNALEQKGISSFELDFNLAQTHVALLNLPKHREYYKRLEARDKERLRSYGEQVKAPAVLMVSAPWKLRMQYLLRPNRGYEGEQKFLDPHSWHLVLEGLLWQGSTLSVTLLGLGLFALGILYIAQTSRKVQPVETMSQRRELSLIWALLPAGLYAAGDKPLQGVIVIAMVLCFLMLGWNVPAKPLGVSSLGIVYTDILLWAAVAVAILFSVLSVVYKKHFGVSQGY